ncbi:MAG: hypothetical protein F4X72_02030 [Dehalococcoidia bacterium]|nr:hypothetical protein [Dehalococcoidia bacterium]
MNTDSERVLGMLSEGKITVDEAERLLEALGGHGPTPDPAPDSIPETETREHSDDEERQQNGSDDAGRDPIGPVVKMGVGAFVSPDVQVPTGSVIGTGAFVDTGVVIQSAINIGNGAYVGEGTQLRKGCKIGSGAYIGERAVIGEGARIRSGSQVPDGKNIPPGSVW